MKTMWTIVSTLAVANLLALGAFLLWLRASERLDGARVERVRQILATTIGEEAELEAAGKAAAEEAAKTVAEERYLAITPTTAESTIRGELLAAEVRLQHLVRRQRELEDLQRALEQQEARVVALRAAFEKEETAFEAYRRSLEETEGAAQFKKALETLEGQKPKDAKAVLQALVGEGKVEEVVAYLNRMEERARNKVMAEFTKDDVALAADLLERLRTRGTGRALPSTGASTTAPDEQIPSTPPS